MSAHPVKKDSTAPATGVESRTATRWKKALFVRTARHIDVR
eukprot:CAMPEP_0184732700 /NCGR_PEP_ID=MMETSP0314-20130426/55160_1 /TAXON_ID=38298 /ORGANISM="Rhodella maculata, Strain CCMP 736" /LENGTH=40 /DNA_ID= /DNA_START= /DNA_END= /DNA_ORIENTATION=